MLIGRSFNLAIFNKFIVYHPLSCSERNVLEHKTALVVIRQKGDAVVEVVKTRFLIGDLRVVLMEGELLGGEAGAVVDMGEGSSGEGEGEEDSDKLC